MKLIKGECSIVFMFFCFYFPSAPLPMLLSLPLWNYKLHKEPHRESFYNVSKLKLN